MKERLHVPHIFVSFCIPSMYPFYVALGLQNMLYAQVSTGKKDVKNVIRKSRKSPIVYQK